MEKDWIYNWNRDAGTAASTWRFEVDDETLRDGLQSPSVHRPDLDTKRRCLRHMAELGIQRVNTGLPMSSQIDHIRALLATIRDESLPLRPGVAVRTVVADLQEVAKLRDEFPTLDIKANTFLRASRIGIWAEDWEWSRVTDMATESIGWATEHGIPTMFVTEDTTRSQPDDIREIHSAAVEAGAGEVCIADTVGFALPHGTRSVVRFVRGFLDEAGFDHVKINWHGHADRGMALANTLAALDAGVDVVHGTILGIGERCGNTALDELLVNLHLLGAWPHPIRPLKDYVTLVSKSAAVPIPISHPAFGRDAFRTATGVHAAAIVKALRKGSVEEADMVYSSVPAALVGRRQEIEVGPLSGHWCVIAWLEAHGLPSDDKAMISAILERAYASEDVLTDEEISEVIEASS
jgi:2-isopropylmalate synthase